MGLLGGETDTHWTNKAHKSKKNENLINLYQNIAMKILKEIFTTTDFLCKSSKSLVSRAETQSYQNSHQAVSRACAQAREAEVASGRRKLRAWVDRSDEACTGDICNRSPGLGRSLVRLCVRSVDLAGRRFFAHRIILESSSRK